MLKWFCYKERIAAADAAKESARKALMVAIEGRQLLQKRGQGISSDDWAAHCAIACGVVNRLEEKFRSAAAAARMVRKAVYAEIDADTAKAIADAANSPSHAGT